MDMTEEQRADLAARIKAIRIGTYGGNRRKAYTAVGINPNTWTRAEAGERLAERSLVAIIHALWPETGGDWRELDPPLGGTRDLEAIEAEVRSWKLPGEAEKKILAILEADRAARDSRAHRGRA